jgi:1-acyl-sn-glycerol-3-phosphate acyltransferase
MATLRAIWRISRLLLHLAFGVFYAALGPRFFAGKRWDALIRRWARQLLAILGIKLVAPRNTCHNGGAMLVANHVSWLDIYVLLALHRVHFVSKAEIRDWPVAGWLAVRTGTLFLDRQRRRDATRINAEIAACLTAGGWVAVFPEGTTTLGDDLLPFKTGLFEPAAAGGLAVLPARIRYLDAAGQTSRAAAYIDEISFGQCLWSIAREPGITAEIHFAAPFSGNDRKLLAQRAEAAIRALGTSAR